MKDRFYVGQRVRFTGKEAFSKQFPYWKDADLPNVLAGERGTIRERSHGYWVVLFDATKSPYSFGQFSVEPHQIEPIYDGDQKSSWSESTWKPRELRKETEHAI